MSPFERVAAPESSDDLSAQDRAWLDERLVEYRRLLEYLRDH
ncbi:MAG: hypothetical protein ACRD0U_09525 [Acidimicrobiales bacterium]